MKEKQIFTNPRMVALLAGMAAALWGLGYSCVKIGYEWWSIQTGDIPSKLLFAGVRFLIAGLLAILFFSITAKQAPIPGKKDWAGIWWLSFFQTVLQYAALYIALAYVTGSKSSILNQLGSFLLVLLAHFFYKRDRFSWGKAAGCMLGFCGIVLINLGSGWEWSFQWLGEGFIVLSSLSAAIGYMISKKITRAGGAILLTGCQQLLGGIVLIIAGAATGGSIHGDSWRDILILLYLSISISMAYIIWALLLQYNDVSRVSVYKFAVPVFGVISSGLLLGEEIWTLRTVMALLLVSLGIAAVNRRPAAKQETGL